MTDEPAPEPAPENAIPRADVAADEAASASPSAPAYPLPTARHIVSRGVELAVRETDHLRTASLYIGLLFFCLAAPAVVHLISIATRAPEFLAPFVDGSEPSLEGAGPLLTIVALFVFAGIGASVLAIEGQAIATALLAGRHVGRPMRLREAVSRSRQVFWRLLAGTFAVGIVGSIVQWLVVLVGGGVEDPGAEGLSLLSILLSSVATAPFGYLVTGIVLGDVGAFEAIRRSVRLTRARLRLAVVLALFTTFASVLQFFALAAGGDVVLRVAEVLDLGFDKGVLPSLLSFSLALAAVLALGTLTFTIGAIVLAPQVVAFVGLTHHHAGLDRARLAPRAAVAVESVVVAESVVAATLPGSAEPEAPAAPPSAWASPPSSSPRRFRWVTVPMAATIGLAVLLALLGVLSGP